MTALTRRTLLASGAAAGLGLLLASCAREPALGTLTPRATIGLTYIPNIQFAPFYTGLAQGAFTDAGVEATLRHHGANEGLFTALAAGDEDFVIAGGDELLQARAQGMDLVAIGQYYHQYPVVLIVPDVSPIVTAVDLAGHRVGVPGRYGESWFGLLASLAASGLTEDDIEVIEIGFTPRAALQRGDVDVVVGFVNNDQVQFQLADIPTRVIPLTPDGTVPLVSIVMVTTARQLAERPAVARAVVAGMVAGIRATVDAPASAVQTAREHIPTLGQPGAEAAASAVLEATIPLWKKNGVISGTMVPADWSAMADIMAKHGLVAQAVDPADAMTNDHVTA